MLTPNRFKSALQSGNCSFGLWSTACSNVLSEIAGEAGFDWILFDTEHAPNDQTQLIAQLQSLRGTQTSAVARPAANDIRLIGQLLDAGFWNLLIPAVQTADEARKAVAATRYPPTGTRGVSGVQRANCYGLDRSYLHEIESRITVIAQIESVEGARNAREIAQTEGIDALFVGPGDLAASMGKLGHAQDPEVQRAILQISMDAHAAGKPVGIIAPGIENSRRYLQLGFCFIAVGGDITIFRDGMLELVAELPPLKEAFIKPDHFAKEGPL